MENRKWHLSVPIWQYSVSGDAPLGFHEHDEGDMGRPDAWCNQCDLVLDKAETEDELDEWFTNCDHKIVFVSIAGMK